VGLAEYEVTLGIAQELSGSIQTLKNLPGSISYLLNKTAEKFSADYILVDMSPSLSSINQNLLMTSDFFILPTVPDFFSVMAIDSLASILPKWYEWAKKASELKILKEATYPFPEITPRIRDKKPSAAFQNWMDEIKQAISQKLIPELKTQDMNMLLPNYLYQEQHLEDGYCLIKMSDFNSLIALSQKHQTPVFALTQHQLKQRGSVWEGTQKSQEKFNEAFSTLADRVINLTELSSNAVCA
jgi:hypothetical protein